MLLIAAIEQLFMEFSAVIAFIYQFVAAVSGDKRGLFPGSRVNVI